MVVLLFYYRFKAAVQRLGEPELRPGQWRRKTAAIKVYPLLYTGISGFVKTFMKSFFLRNREKIVYNGEKAVQTDNEKGEKNEIYFVECKWAPGLCAEGIY